jgi:hypothetical protein
MSISLVSSDENAPPASRDEVADGVNMEPIAAANGLASSGSGVWNASTYGTAASPRAVKVTAEVIMVDEGG